MPTLADLVRKIASKNAGPFWVTVDVFCGSRPAFDRVAPALATDRVAALLGVETHRMRRFDIPALHVIKFSLPRPVAQGSRQDRDMHGAQIATLLEELEIEA
jgi:hypothetical protein